MQALSNLRLHLFANVPLTETHYLAKPGFKGWRKRLYLLMGPDGMGWDGMGWDGMGWDGMGCKVTWQMIVHTDEKDFVIILQFAILLKSHL